MLLPLLLTVTAWAPATPVADAACVAAACTTAGEVKVCKCLPTGEGSEPGLVVEGPGERHLEWDAHATLADVTDFFVLGVDLDGDGHDELLVANFAGELGPLTVRAWELAIVDGATGEVTHAVAHDFGRDAVSPRRTLLLAEWELGGATPVFAGREYRYEDRRLVPTSEPVRRRSLDAAFAEERRLHLASAERTLPARALLAHASTRRGDDAPPKKLTPVLVTGLSREEPWLHLHLQRAGGEIDGTPPTRLGSAKARRLYPLGYAPADAEGWLVGRAARTADGLVWID